MFITLRLQDAPDNRVRLQVSQIVCYHAAGKGVEVRCTDGYLLQVVGSVEEIEE